MRNYSTLFSLIKRYYPTLLQNYAFFEVDLVAIAF